jgi:hypothetical protein
VPARVRTGACAASELPSVAAPAEAALARAGEADTTDLLATSVDEAADAAGVSESAGAAAGAAVAGCSTDAGADGAELAAAGCWAGGCGASAAGRAARGGRNVSGSTYPCSSEVTRTPKYTNGCERSTTPLGPTVPTTAPSVTFAPRSTPIEPRCTSVAVYPAGVSIEIVFPPVGTVPAKETTPPAGACTSLSVGAPRSTPRCCPAAYGCERSNENCRSTGPSTGHVHARAVAGSASAQRAHRTSRRSTTPPLLPDLRTTRP